MWIVLIWPTLHDNGSFGGLSSTQMVLLLSDFLLAFQTGFPARGFQSQTDPYQCSSSTYGDVGWRHSGENALRRLPSMPRSPVGKNILFQRESTPTLTIKAGMRALLPGRSSRPCHGKCMDEITRRIRTPLRGRRRQEWPCFSLVVNIESTFFVSFCQFPRKLVRYRVTRRARNCSYYYTWTRESAPVRGRQRALLSTCQPWLLPVLQGRFLPLVLQV